MSIRKTKDFEVDVVDKHGRTYTFTVRSVLTEAQAIKRGLRLCGADARWAGNVRPYVSLES